MSVAALEQNSIESIGYVRRLEIYIVYDNYVFNEKLKPSWGVSFYIIADDNVLLFDTGGDGEILISNMRELNLKPEDIKVIVLSHIHGDHIGGLYKLLSINSEVIVYLPSSFPRNVKDEIKQFGAKIVEVSGPTIICNGVASTGEMPSGIGLYEQALIINTTLGPLILTGCAHPGVDNIVVKVAKMMKCSSILLVGGGFHLAGASDTRILKIIDTFKKYNVKLVMPIHCSGDRTRELFGQAYGEKCLPGGVGFHLTLGDLERLVENERTKTGAKTVPSITSEVKTCTTTIGYTAITVMIILFILMVFLTLYRRMRL